MNAREKDRESEKYVVGKTLFSVDCIVFSVDCIVFSVHCIVFLPLSLSVYVLIVALARLVQTNNHICIYHTQAVRLYAVTLYTYISTHMNIFICTYIYIHTHTCTYIHVHIYIYI